MAEGPRNAAVPPDPTDHRCMPRYIWSLAVMRGDDAVQEWEEGLFADEFGDAPTEGKILPFRPKTPLH